MICFWSFDCAAQSKRPNKVVLPRVGTIKDYPATGLMVGCGNLYFYHAAHPVASDASYVFLSRGDGSNAWMNLGGRDLRLRQVKPTGRKSLERQPYYYRFGKLQIIVAFENFKPDGAPVQEADSMFKMTITLKHRRAVRIIRAVGDTDC